MSEFYIIICLLSIQQISVIVLVNELLMSALRQLTTPDLLLWTDCEFTGLEVEKGHKVIEIGALVTTLALEEVDAYESFVQYDWDFVESMMQTNPWWDGRDDDITRMRAGVQTGKPPQAVDAELVDLTDAYFLSEKPSLCGNSVHSDKKHIDVEFPEFASRLDYRIIDVTSLKLLAFAYQGIRYGEKSYQHHATNDIRESVDELRFLLRELGISDLTEFA